MVNPKFMVKNNVKIPISVPYIGKEEKNAVLKVLNSRKIVQGEKVKFFEEKFRNYCGTKYAVAVNNGTSALHTALYAAGIGPGDEVITTPFTFVATANSILMAGAKPVFVDIDEKTFNIDPGQAEKAITRKTKALLVVNLYGQPADYEKLKKIARKHKLKIIEDAAQSVGARYHNDVSGNLADIGCFSFYATKNIMCGEGGILTTNSKESYEKAQLFRNHGQSENKKYSYQGLGFNYRLTDLYAAILIGQLKRLGQITKRRNEIASIYNAAFKNIKGIVIPDIAPGRTHVFHQYTLRITPQFKITRDKFQKYLSNKGIQTNVYYPIPLYRFKHLADKRYVDKKFPITEKMIQEVVSIPAHPLLTKQELAYIIRTIISL